MARWFCCVVSRVVYDVYVETKRVIAMKLEIERNYLASAFLMLNATSTVYIAHQPDDETIYARVDDVDYLCEPTHDDDFYHFVSFDQSRHVRIPIISDELILTRVPVHVMRKPDVNKHFFLPNVIDPANDSHLDLLRTLLASKYPNRVIRLEMMTDQLDIYTNNRKLVSYMTC